MQYRFTADYASGLGAWKKGETAEFDERTAAWLRRDVAGIIEPVDTERSEDSPPHDRQVKRAPSKRSRSRKAE